MALAILGGRILAGGAFHEGQALLVENSRIAAIVPQGDVPSDAERHDLGGAMLVPGFIDTQVNGGGGVLFNDLPTVEGIAAIGEAYRRFGTTGFLPTLISDDLEVIRRAITAVDHAIEAGVPGVLGIHIEGPFLNVKRKGIHRADRIRALDEEGLEVLTSLRRGVTLVTLAPECTTPAMIGRLADAGVVVSAGHSEATYEQVVAATDAGLTGFTHLFNAMSQLGSRAPGMVGAALEQPGAWSGIIVDGHHVSPVTLKLALRCKPPASFMLVTDAMPAVGTDQTEFMLQGEPIFVRDGMCTDANGTLAGSHLDMATAVRNTVSLLDQPVENASLMASGAPAAFLGLSGETGSIAVGKRADLVALDGDIQVAGCWIGGTRFA